MSITRIVPVRVVGHSHSGGCGSSALKCELPHPAEGVKQDQHMRVKTREYSERDSLFGPDRPWGGVRARQVLVLHPG